MKKFIFFTTEGYTFEPNNKQITNMQILDSVEGVGRLIRNLEQ
ncbi:hypothetical protein N9W00_00335 [Arcobacteraceae bacterium]|nr:hypothetical protein [Arcobacteraceae bacterium]